MATGRSRSLGRTLEQPHPLQGRERRVGDREGALPQRGRSSAWPSDIHTHGRWSGRLQPRHRPRTSSRPDRGSRRMWTRRSSRRRGRNHSTPSGARSCRRGRRRQASPIRRIRGLVERVGGVEPIRHVLGLRGGQRATRGDVFRGSRAIVGEPISPLLLNPRPAFGGKCHGPENLRTGARRDSGARPSALDGPPPPPGSSDPLRHTRGCGVRCLVREWC